MTAVAWSGTERLVAHALRDGTARLAAAGIATARQDAELLLARVLGSTRLALHVEPRRSLPAAACRTFDALIGRRVRQEPIQYLLGTAEFCGLNLYVGPGVFIPRPETEALVARALAVLPAGPTRAIDLCAGSAAVACALAVGHPGLQIWAVEREPTAAGWARENVERRGLRGRVTVTEGDLFAPLAAQDLAGRCDAVVANPPYIAGPRLAELPVEVRRWEPAAALDGGPDGTTLIARILTEAPAFLRPSGTLLVEVGEDHAPWLRAQLAGDRHYVASTIHPDFRGCPRVLEARRA